MMSSILASNCFETHHSFLKNGSLTEPGYAGKDMNVSVHDSNWYPEVLVREDDLLIDISLLINGKLDHPQPGPFSWSVIIPIECGLRGMRDGDLSHPLISWFVENQRQAKCLANGLICDIIMARHKCVRR